MVTSVEDSKSETECLSRKFVACCFEDDTPLVLSHKLKIVVDAKLNCSLFDFQRRGVQSLFQFFIKGSGAILNDVPGSGKKVQVIALISALISSRKQSSSEHVLSSSNPALIICPRFKIRVWENRIKEWSSLKYSVCSDLNISKATDSTDIVLFPFDLLAKSVVNVAKRRWALLFVDNIEAITLKQKYELLLHHLPRIPRFGISSKNLDHTEVLVPIIGWVFPKYYEQLKKDRVKTLSFIKQFEDKTGPVVDQIRGLHLKANLLTLQNELFVKRDGTIPEGLFSIPRDAEEEEFDFLPSTSSSRLAPTKTKKRKSNEKIKPKSKSRRVNTKKRVVSHEISDDDEVDDDDADAADDEEEIVAHNQNPTTSVDESVSHRSSRRNRSTRRNHFEESPSDESQPSGSNSTRRSSAEALEPQPSCSKSAGTEEMQPGPSSPTRLVTKENNSEYESIDALFLSSTKVLRSPQKSRKKAPASQRGETIEVFSNSGQSLANTDVTNPAESLGVFGDFETQQYDLLDSLFLKTPPVSKPAPSKFKSFTQASQKTKACRECSDAKPLETICKGGISPDLDRFLFESQVRKPPPRKLGDSKAFRSQQPDDPIDDILFSQPICRRGPPRKKFAQSDKLTDAGTSRQPMQSIKNLDQDSQPFE